MVPYHIPYFTDFLAICNYHSVSPSRAALAFSVIMSTFLSRVFTSGLSGLGPTMYAFAGVGGSPPAPNSVLEYTTLLQYGSVEGTDNYNFPNSIDGYNHADNWREALWLNAYGRDAVAVIGEKALGFNWYGYHGESMRLDWVFADIPFPDFWETDPNGKGWRAHNRQPATRDTPNRTAAWRWGFIAAVAFITSGSCRTGPPQAPGPRGRR